jgi:hypothetical protein
MTDQPTPKHARVIAMLETAAQGQRQMAQVCASNEAGARERGSDKEIVWRIRGDIHRDALNEYNEAINLLRRDQ